MADQALFIDILKRENDVTLEVIDKVAADIEQLLSTIEIGEYDGDELAVDGSDARLYFYGPDADIILSSVEKVLKKHLSHFAVGAHLRYGDVDDKNAAEKKIRLFGWQ